MYVYDVCFEINNNNAIINTCTMPKPGTEWYTLCGTSYIDVETGRNTYVEYVMMVCGVCFLGMYVFTAILAYPRTLFDIVFVHFATYLKAMLFLFARWSL